MFYRMLDQLLLYPHWIVFLLCFVLPVVLAAAVVAGVIRAGRMRGPDDDPDDHATNTDPSAPPAVAVDLATADEVTPDGAARHGVDGDAARGADRS